MINIACFDLSYAVLPCYLNQFFSPLYFALIHAHLEGDDLRVGLVDIAIELGDIRLELVLAFLHRLVQAARLHAHIAPPSFMPHGL